MVPTAIAAVTSQENDMESHTRADDEDSACFMLFETPASASDVPTQDEFRFRRGPYAKKTFLEILASKDPENRNVEIHDSQEVGRPSAEIAIVCTGRP